MDPLAYALVLHVNAAGMVTTPFRHLRYPPSPDSSIATRTNGALASDLVVRWGRRILLTLLAGWGFLLAVRCHLPRQVTIPTADSTSAVYLVRHGWHAGIAVRLAEIPDDRWPVLENFPNARYLEVGWGEARYYPGEIRGVWGAVRAGAWPTGSVLHVVPVSDSVMGTFAQNTVIRIPVSETELDALTRYVAASFTLTDDGAAVPAADGYYPGSRFYRSKLTYHVFNNCNHWAAAALEAAGCETAPRWTMRVQQVIARARACGTLIQRRPTN